MPVRTKSVYETPDPGDGVRVLTTTYWPRGIAKAKVDEYRRMLGPTRELLRSFKDGTVEWDAYRQAYMALMQGDEQRAQIAELAALAETETITIMCMCRDDTQCHRSVLRDLVSARMEIER